MSSKEAVMGRIYLLCAPNFGILDNWLPVVKNLRDMYPSYEFGCLIPKAGTAEMIDPESALTKLSQNCFDEVIFQSHSGHWLKVKSFQEAADINFMGPFALFQRKVISKLTAKLLFFGKLYAFWKSVSYHYYSLRFRKITVDYTKEFSDAKALLYDVSDETKEYNESILQQFVGKPKYSIFHGIDISIEPVDPPLGKLSDKNNIKAFLFSSLEKERYIKKFGLDDDQLDVVGVPRHNNNWLKEVREASGNNSEWEGFVFIISRPISPYLPSERKRQAIQDIKDIIIDKLKLKVVVKLHPKERDEGLFADVLGYEEQGKRWKYSNAHPMVMGERSLFGLTFYSGVSLDMIFLQKPIIEYLNLRDIPLYDNKSSCRDSSGAPVFSYRHFGFVLGVERKEELEEVTSDILEKREEVLKGLSLNYDNCFPSRNALAHVIEVMDKDLFNH